MVNATVSPKVKYWPAGHNCNRFFDWTDQQDFWTVTLAQDQWSNAAGWVLAMRLT